MHESFRFVHLIPEHTVSRYVCDCNLTAVISNGQNNQAMLITGNSAKHVCIINSIQAQDGRNILLYLFVA